MTDKPGRILWLNGSFVAEDDARVSPLDRGFLYGDALFETLRAQDGQPLYVADHLKRLRDGCRQLRLDSAGTPRLLPEDARLWRDRLEELLGRNGLSLGPARIRIQITRGRAEGLGLPAPHTPTLLAMAAPYHPPSERDYAQGRRLHLVGGIFTPPLSPFKTGNYLAYLEAGQAARDAGFDEALLKDKDGILAETSTGSLLFLKEGTCTLSASPLRLPGTAEQRIACMFHDDGWQVIRAPVTEKDIPSYEALWITNSLMGILPVRAVDQYRFPRLFRRKAARYRERFFREGRLA